MFTIELLPAAHGDAIWIEYGSASQPHRVLIDGGPAPTYEKGLRRRITALPEGQRNLELMIVTHIDADHIDGSIILLQEYKALKVKIEELWFNSWEQISDMDTAPSSYAPLQGEFLGGLIKVDGNLGNIWNNQFAHRAVAVSDSKSLPVVELPGGAALTLLGPTDVELRRLRARWEAAIRDFSPGDTKEALSRLAERRDYRPPPTPASFAAPQFGDDRSPANGASISCVFKYKNVSVLLAGDAHARSLAESLKRLANQQSEDRLHFEAVKLPHHGSMSNISEEWLQWIDCERWLISTNGAVFGHPDLQTAQLIADVTRRYAGSQPNPKPASLFCNYPNIGKRLAEEAKGQWATVFPKNEMAGLVLSLPAGPG